MVITWWAYLFDLESSIPFYFLIFSFIINLLHFLLHFFHYLGCSNNTEYFAWKEMDSLDDSYLLTSVIVNNIFAYFTLSLSARKDVGSLKSTSLLSSFHIGSRCCFFPANLMSSINTEKNNPFSRCANKHYQFGTFSHSCSDRTFSNCPSHNSPAKGWPYRFLSRGTTGSSILDHDSGHLCRGRRIQMSGHSDLGIFSNLGASSILTWV